MRTAKLICGGWGRRVYSVIPWVSSPSRRGGDQEFAFITFSFVRCIMHLEPILSRALIMFEKTTMPSFWSLALNRIVRRSCTLAAAGSGPIETRPAFDYYRFSRSSPICIGRSGATRDTPRRQRGRGRDRLDAVVDSRGVSACDAPGLDVGQGGAPKLGARLRSFWVFQGCLNGLEDPPPVQREHLSAT